MTKDTKIRGRHISIFMISSQLGKIDIKSMTHICFRIFDNCFEGKLWPQIMIINKIVLTICNTNTKYIKV